MFRRLHIQMTFFSALIIGIVIFIMTTACNFIAENSTRQNAWNTFQNNAISCISHLETQSIISSDWILQAEKNYDISMDIRDNGNSLYLKKLQTDSLDETIFRKAEEISAASYALDLSNPGAVSKLTKRIFFQMKDFYVSTALIPKSHGTVSMIILYSLDSVKHRILLQRLAFSGAAFLAILALSICSWFFTGRMITPLEKSRQEQTEFIAAASHELRSPLAVILSGISAMKKADPKEQGHFLSVIEKEGTRMSLLINDMLSLSNADNHSWKMHPVFCELDTLLLDTYEKYEPLMQDHHMKFFIELPRKSLPVPVTRKGSVRCLESFLTMPSVMSPKTGKLFFPFHRPKRTFLSASKTTDPVFRILPRLLFSGVFTRQILPEITGSILVWDCVLRMRSFHFIKEQSLYWIPRAVVLLFRFLCR